MGETQQGGLWAQWVHGVTTTGTQIVTVNPNERVVSAYASIRSFSVIHPAQHYIAWWEGGVPPSPEHGFARIIEVHWNDSSGVHHEWTGARAFLTGGLVTKIKFKVYNTSAVLIINYWNTQLDFSP
jgi:hypothetical protein